MLVPLLGLTLRSASGFTRYQQVIMRNILLLLWLGPAVAAADTGADNIMRGMADMFSLMLQQMRGGNSGMQGWPSAFSASGMPAWGQMPLTMPGGSGFEPMRMMNPVMGMGGAEAGLQGYWLGANGERLGFWQNQVQLQSQDGRVQSGQFALQAQVLVLGINGVAQPFEYAQQGDQLALRDPNGRIFLYRRVPNTWGRTP